MGIGGRLWRINMEHVKHPYSGEVRYVTHTWAKWLKLYGWLSASFEEYMEYQMKKYYLVMIRAEARR